MEKRNLYIDFDGVILDTMKEIKKDYQKADTSTKAKEKSFFVNYPWEKIINDQHLIGNAISDIQEIIDTDKFNLAILTHVNSINEATLKIKYLRKYFKDITIIPCPKEISKTKMIKTKDAILIDDYKGNLNEWKEEGGISIKFSRKNKSSQHPVIKEIKEILQII